MIKLRHGDTLIEVTIAIGIFSMIAIGVAAVMSSGTSGSQTALETTLARGEIDAQAEALRFIHSSYISSKNVVNTENNQNANPYQAIWEKITSKAVTVDENSPITQFSPETCDELYSKDPNDKNSIFNQNAFVLNVKQLSSGVSAYIPASEGQDASSATDTFTATTTYPRLVFSVPNNDNNNDDTNTKLYDTNVRNNLFRAEGIYVIAVKDQGTTQIVTDKNIDKSSAFYDFYIRTCWYGTDAARPSTIATLVRLYDPNINASK